MTQTSDPAAVLAAFEARALRVTTPCGDGAMVWRVWGEGAPVVLLHGGFGSWNHWIRNIDALAAQYRVIAADMPGQGDSDDPPHPYDAESLADIVAEGVSRVTHEGERVRLVCFSFGAVVGSLVAARLGDRVVSFTAVGAAGFGARGRVTQDMTRITPEMSPAEQDAAYRHNLGLLMVADPAHVDDLAMLIQRRNTERNRIRSRPISVTDKLSVTLPSIRARIDLIWGDRDVTAIGYFEPRHALLRSIQPDARIAMLDGVGHWVQYEDPERFNATLLEFLAAG
ncbi:alpha/beta fold hydrolase [Thalassobaculum sp.]|uniref:alpha/beta fold hydrolase n=1 Tax=Thalassobaculum sp. TaxID=2022740 RepID=UPI0032EC47E4